MYGICAVLFLTLTLSIQAQTDSLGTESDSTTTEEEEVAPKPTGPTAASLYNEALEFSKTKAFDKALPLYLQAVEQAQAEDNQQVLGLARTNGTRAAYALGKSLNDKDAKAALDAYEKGIQLDSTYYINYYGKAKLLEDSKKTGEALVAYIQAGNILAKSDKAEDQEKSVTYFSKAESLAGQPMNDKKWADMQKYSESYLALRETPEAHYYLGVALKEQGKAEEALTHLDKAIETANADSDKDKYYMAKAEAYEKLGKKDDAVTTYKKVGGKYADRAKYKVNELSSGK